MMGDDTETHVIGEGTYGCVHKPPVKCKNKTRKNKTRKNNTSSISKLMTDSNAKNELREFKFISSADNKKQLYLGKPYLDMFEILTSNVFSINHNQKHANRVRLRLNPKPKHEQ